VNTEFEFQKFTLPGACNNRKLQEEGLFLKPPGRVEENYGGDQEKIKEGTN
jgi:hypothetical protein